MDKSNRDRPIFILGNPRSGTSLLRLMLHSHSQICIPPESHFFLWLEVKYGIWSLEMLEDFIKDLFNATKFETWNINREELSDFIINAAPKTYSFLISLIYQFYAEKHRGESKYWGDKNSLWTDKLERIRFYYPNCFIIHLIRDGRDVACSYRELAIKNLKSKYAPQLPVDIIEIAQQWNSNNLSLESFISTFQDDSYVQIKYEDLLTDPERILNKILKPLGLEVEQKQLSYYSKPMEQIEPKEFLGWKQKLIEPLDIKNIGKFKNQLSRNEILTFESYANESLSRYNYLG